LGINNKQHNTQLNWATGQKRSGLCVSCNLWSTNSQQVHPFFHSITEVVGGIALDLFSAMLRRETQSQTLISSDTSAFLESGGSGAAAGDAWRQAELNRHSERGPRTTRKQALRDVQELAARETIFISRWKRFFVVLLLASATLVATGAFVMLSREEEANYEDAVSQRRENWDTSIKHGSL
jgi:hypothetical protein